MKIFIVLVVVLLFGKLPFSTSSMLKNGRFAPRRARRSVSTVKNRGRPELECMHRDCIIVQHHLQSLVVSSVYGIFFFQSVGELDVLVVYQSNFEMEPS